MLSLPSAHMQDSLPVPAVVFHNPLATPPPDDDSCINDDDANSTNIPVAAVVAAVHNTNAAFNRPRIDVSSTILDYTTAPSSGLSPLSSAPRYQRASYDASASAHTGGERITYEPAFGHSAEPSTSVTGTVSARANGASLFTPSTAPSIPSREYTRRLLANSRILGFCLRHIRVLDRGSTLR